MTATAIAAEERPTMDPRRYLGSAWRHPVLRAVLKAALTILVATAITFVLIRLLPGNPVDLRIDELTRDGSIVSSVPNYLIAILIVLIFGVQLELLPITQMRGATSPGIHPGFTPEFVGDVLFHAALPILVFFLTHIGHWILSMRNATLATLEEDFVIAARARGLPDSRITTAYVGRNAVLPLVTQLAISVGFIVGGAVLIEQIFLYQGVGLRLIRAVNQRDYPVMQGILLLVTISVVVANLVADLLYSRLDPRIGRASS